MVNGANAGWVLDLQGVVESPHATAALQAASGAVRFVRVGEYCFDLNNRLDARAWRLFLSLGS